MDSNHLAGIWMPTPVSRLGLPTGSKRHRSRMRDLFRYHQSTSGSQGVSLTSQTEAGEPLYPGLAAANACTRKGQTRSIRSMRPPEEGAPSICIVRYLIRARLATAIAYCQCRLSDIASVSITSRANSAALSLITTRSAVSALRMTCGRLS